MQNPGTRRPARRTYRPARGMCPVCLGDFALKADGTLRGHGWKGVAAYSMWCPGTWEKPLSIEGGKRMELVTLAGCVIRDDDQRVLLLHRKTERLTQWEMPGGKTNPGEDSQAAALREMREELGVDVELTGTLGTCTFTEDDVPDTVFVYVWFSAIVVGGSPYPLEPKVHDAMRYWDLAELRAIPDELSANLTRFLAKVAGR